MVGLGCRRPAQRKIALDFGYGLLRPAAALYAVKEIKHYIHGGALPAAAGVARKAPASMATKPMIPGVDGGSMAPVATLHGRQTINEQMCRVGKSNSKFKHHNYYSLFSPLSSRCTIISRCIQLAAGIIMSIR